MDWTIISQFRLIFVHSQSKASLYEGFEDIYFFDTNFYISLAIIDIQQLRYICKNVKSNILIQNRQFSIICIILSSPCNNINAQMHVLCQKSSSNIYSIKDLKDMMKAFPLNMTLNHRNHIHRQKVLHNIAIRLITKYFRRTNQ